MFKNYILSAIRNIRRNKLSSGISIFGLAIGITAAFLMFNYIQFELSFDNYHHNQERIYRLSTVLRGEEKSEYVAPTAMFVAPKVKELLDEVETSARVIPMEAVIKTDTYKVSRNEYIFQVDPEIYDIIDIKWLTAENKKALTMPHSVVLTQSLAKDIFGELWLEGILGKSVFLNQENYSISGIIEDAPPNADWQYEALVPLASDAYKWSDFQAFTYVLLKEGVEVSNFHQSLQEFDQHFFSSTLQKEWETDFTYAFHTAIPIKDLHFKEGFMGEMSEKGNMNLIIVLSLIAIFLLAIASINFINLFISQSIKRNVEVGIRKVVGARKSQLVIQYLSESIIFTLISSVIAIVLIQFIEPIWFSYTGISLKMDSTFDKEISLYLFIILLLVGIFSGSYAAFFLASSNPVSALKNSFKISSPRSFHNVLQLVQFVIATGMVLCTLIVYQQLDFLLNKQLGFDREKIMVLNLPKQAENLDRVEAFRKYILDRNYAEGMTLGGKPGDLYLKGTVIQETDGQNIEVPVNAIYADKEYLDVLGIELADGNNFYNDACNCHQYLINEALSNRLNWEKPVGETVNFDGEGKIVGVVKDFHYQSLHHAIKPLIIILNQEGSKHALIKLNSDKVESIASAWQTFFSGIPINYSFLEQEIASQYSNEKHMIDLFTFFSMLTILISCMGLFGMSAMNAQLRTKAMGIHKIMGARKLQIFYLLSKDALSNVFFAIIISLPLSALIMLRWLRHFEYHVSFDWFQLLNAASIVLFLAMITSGYHGLQIIRNNPILSLKDE